MGRPITGSRGRLANKIDTEVSDPPVLAFWGNAFCLSVPGLTTSLLHVSARIVLSSPFIREVEIEGGAFYTREALDLNPESATS